MKEKRVVAISITTAYCATAISMNHFCFCSSLAICGFLPGDNQFREQRENLHMICKQAVGRLNAKRKRPQLLPQPLECGVHVAKQGGSST